MNPSFHLISKKSISEFSDRDLIELLLTNQINLFRMLSRIEENLSNSNENYFNSLQETPGLGDNFKEVLRKHRSVLTQIEEVLYKDDVEKGNLSM